jgi:hypothetical protein
MQLSKILRKKSVELLSFSEKLRMHVATILCCVSGCNDRVVAKNLIYIQFELRHILLRTSITFDGLNSFLYEFLRRDRPKKDKFLDPSSFSNSSNRKGNVQTSNFIYTTNPIPDTFIRDPMAAFESSPRILKHEQ